MPSVTTPRLSPGDVRDGFRFRGGHPVLDLTATLAGRLKEKHRDLLAAPEDVARWLRAAGFECTASALDSHTLDAAQQLREAIYALTMRRLAEQPLPASARTTLNQMAQLPAAAPELDRTGHARLRGDASLLLAYVAREAIALLGSETAERIRQCEGDGCAILFLDTSRSGDRRWCSMTACGNRHKVAEFRRRKREAQ